MSKFSLWYDVETTGLHIKNGAAVVQFGGILMEGDKVLHEFNLDINPHSYNREVSIDPKALAINDKKEEDFESFMTLEIAVKTIMHELTVKVPRNKVVLCGYNNSTFDKYFLEDMFEDQGKSFSTYFQWKQIDVFETFKGLAYMGLMPETFNQKLGTVAEALDVEPAGELHDALVDIRLTRDVLLKIRERLLWK